MVGPAYKITTNRGTTELSRRGALWSCSGRGLRALLTQPVNQSSDDGRGGFVGIQLHLSGLVNAAVEREIRRAVLTRSATERNGAAR